MSTLTCYPDPHEEVDTVDGQVSYSGANQTWAALIAQATGTDVGDDSETGHLNSIYSGTATDTWRGVYKSILLFNSSSLGSSASISATVLSIYGYDKADALSIIPDVDIYTSNPASNVALATGDFDSLGNVSQTGNPIAYDNWSITGYNDFTFSPTGRGNVSKTDISKFGTRNASYDVTGTPPTWNTPTVYSKIRGYLSEQANTTYDPKLVVTYTTVAHYTLTAEAGSYSKTGQSAGLKAARKMAASAGSYALTGQAVGLRAARKIPAGAGSYALTGQDVALRAIRKLAAEGGSYVLTGQAANLVIGQHYILTAEAGCYGEPYSKIFVTLDGRIYKKMGNTYLRLS